MKKFTILIPIYNDWESLEKLLDEINSSVKNIKDTQCGFKLIRQDVKYLFDKLTIEGFAFDFELIFLAKKYKFKVKEMPVRWVNNFGSTVRWYDYPKTMLILILIHINNLLGKYK